MLYYYSHHTLNYVTLSTISFKDVVEQTKIPLKPGETRNAMDKENFTELGAFVNKYREKLYIQQTSKRTMVDKLEGKRKELAAADKIDFDYTNFK